MKLRGLTYRRRPLFHAEHPLLRTQIQQVSELGRRDHHLDCISRYPTLRAAPSCYSHAAHCGRLSTACLLGGILTGSADRPHLRRRRRRAGHWDSYEQAGCSAFTVGRNLLGFNALLHIHHRSVLTRRSPAYSVMI